MTILKASIGPSSLRSKLSTPWRCIAALWLVQISSLTATVRGDSLSTLISKATTESQTCVESLNTIYESEKTVKDDSIVRTYILCPETEYKVALNFAEDGTPLDGQYPIPVGRPNIHVLCGEDGRSKNNCRLVRGLVHVGIVDEFGAGTPAHNTLLQGITFFRATSVNVIAMIGGHITIRDCLFQRNRNVASIYAVLPRGNQRKLSLTTSDEHLESFIKQRSFHRRAQETRNATSLESDLHIKVTKSAFTDNVLGASPGAEATSVVFSVGASFEMVDTAIVGTTKDAQKVEEMPNLIRIEGAAVTLKNNCFVGNDAGIAPVVTKNAAVIAESNFNQRTTSLLPSSGCEFIAHNVITDFATSKKGYMCQASDADVCMSQQKTNYRYPCVSYLDSIYFDEDQVTNANIPRTYLLCPNTVFRVGSRHTDEGTPVGGSYPIILGRSNIRVLCGIDGSSENNCQIHNGVVQVAHFDEFKTGGIPITNALVQGISFSGASSINALVSGIGDVVFRDCQFENNDNVASVYVQVIQPRVRARRKLSSTLREVATSTPRRAQMQSNSQALTAMIDGCVFANNTIGSALNPVSGLITNFGSSLTITDSMIFNTENRASPDYLGYYEVGYLVGNFGGDMKLAQNCFFDNHVTIAPVINNRGKLSAMFNAGRQELSQQPALQSLSEQTARNVDGVLGAINNTVGGATNATWNPPIDHNLARCEFIANVSADVLGEIHPELVAFTCDNFDSTSCSHADAPSSTPTMSPTLSPQPSVQPSFAPSTQPSLAPSPGIVKTDVGTNANGPSDNPETNAIRSSSTSSRLIHVTLYAVPLFTSFVIYFGI